MNADLNWGGAVKEEINFVKNSVYCIEIPWCAFLNLILLGLWIGLNGISVGDVYIVLA